MVRFAFVATVAAGTLALLAAVGPARADTVFTSSSAFSAATTGAVSGDFSTVPTGDVCAGTSCFSGYDNLSGYSSLKGVSFTTPNDGGRVNVNSANFYGSPNDPGVPYLVNSGFTPGAAPDTIVIHLAGPATAFALNFNTLFNSTTLHFALDNGDSLTYDFANTPTNATTAFLGFISSTSFSTITLSDPNDQSIVITDFTTATAIAGPVPEASTWAMMLLGFAGLGFMGYRRTASRA